MAYSTLGPIIEHSINYSTSENSDNAGVNHNILDANAGLNHLNAEVIEHNAGVNHY